MWFVSKRLMLSNANVTGLIDRLAREGHVERVASAGDRQIKEHEAEQDSELASVDCRSLIEQAEQDETGMRVMNFHRTFEQASENPPK